MVDRIWITSLSLPTPDLKLQEHSERINWLYGIDNKGILYFIIICKFVLHIFYIHKIYNKYYMYTYIFIGNLVVKHLPVYHSSQPTSFAKSVIHVLFPFSIKLCWVFTTYQTQGIKELERWSWCSPRAHNPVWEAKKQQINGRGQYNKCRNTNNASAVQQRELENQRSLLQVIP